MKLIISPAKTLNENLIKFKGSKIPFFINESQKLINELKKKQVKEIQQIMKISEKLAEKNYQRFQSWNKNFNLNNSKPCIFAFQGDVYEGINIASYSPHELKYLQENLFILSGLYGILKPFDLIQPYRLEMGAKLKTKNFKNLYEFWGDKLAKYINKTCQPNQLIINLASNEYFSSIKQHLVNPIITPVFHDRVKGNFKIVSFWAKRARGLMISFIIKNKITTLAKLKKFNLENYSFSNYDVKKKTLLFQREH